MSSPNRNISSPRTPPRQTSPANVPSTPPKPIYTSTPSNHTYTPRENARYPSNTLSPTTPPRQISSNIKNRVPSTLARAINTSLPSTPPTQRPEYLAEDVELTPLRRSLSRNQSQHSPFHDRHSVAEAIDEDPFEYHSPSRNKLKTMSKHQFSSTSPKVHQEEFGGELHEVRPVSEARRSLYSPQPPIPMSTMQDHPDLFPSIMADPTPPPTTRPPRLTGPIKPRFRDLLVLSQKRDIFFDLIPAIVLAIAGSLVQPYMSVIIGEAFAVFSNYPTQLSEATAEMNMALSAGVIKSSIKLTIAGLIAMLLNYVKGALWIRHGEGVVARLREAVFVGVQGKKMEWFDLGMGINPDEKDEEGKNVEAIGAGGLMAKFTKETDEVRMATSGSFGNLVQYSFTFLFCFILAMYRAPILALVTLSTIPGVVLIQIVAQILIGPMLDDERRAIAEASTNIERTTAAISTVKIHNAQTTEGDRFAPIVKKAKIALIKQARVWSVTTGSSETLLLSTFVLGFWYGAKLVREGKANPGDVMTVFWAALLAATYLQMVVEQLVVVTKGKTSMASLRTVIRDLPSRPTSSQYSPANTPSASKFGHRIRPTSMRQIRPTRCHGEYNFQNVSFYYPSRPEQWVLRDVTLFLPPGETTFIVGGSGSGKSTVAQLLLRLYTPVGGEITLDDQSITYLDDEFTKEHIAAVQQGCILFDMSVHDNVAMGLAGAGVDSKTGIRKRPNDVTRSEVEEACRMAMIHDFVVGLPEGYDTILGTGGNALSGGQRQRLAIARARIRDPTILVLDEATSALDATSRVQVFESIKKWRQNRTTIVITHDLSQIIPDDFVYVMKDGVVAEQGFRSDLMAKGPLYGVFAGLAAEQAVQPVPARHEEYIEYEGSFIEVLEGDDDGRPRLGPILPVNRLGYRPSSTAYYGLLDEYTKGSRRSVFDDGNGNGGRPMSVAQKRLSWAPRDLVAPRPISRMSFISRPSYGSRPSYEDTPSISIRRPSFDSNPSPYATQFEKDKQLSASTLSYRHNAKSFHESEDDIKDLKIIVPDTTAKPVLKKHKSVAAIIFSHFPKLPTKHLLIIGIGASVGHGVCTPFWSNYLSNIMAVVGQGGRSPTLTQNTLIVLALSVGQGVSNIIQDWTLFTLAANWTAKLRLQTFNTVIAQDRSFFDETINAPSAIMQTLIKDIDDMRNLMAEVIGKVVVFVVMVGMGLIWAMIVQWRLTLVGLSVGPALAVTVVLNEAMVGKAEARNKLKREAVAKTFYESVANVRGIRAMALGSTFLDKFQSEAQSAKSLGQRDAWGVALGAAMSAGLPLFIQALMNWAGMLFILQGHMNYAQMLQVYNLVLFSLTFGTALLDFIPQLSKAKIAASDFDRLYKLSHTTTETAGELRYPITGNVSFSKINFAYPTRPDVPIFQNLSFDLRAGECVAIVGPSGSGKSTIAALLQRLYEPSNGSILFDKHRLDSTDIRWLREHVAVVSQSANLFDASVTENIAYGSSVGIEEIRRAARAANIYDFIMSLPEGYETRLGENASLISGGQAQRLQIARALVRRSNILILDEATSALDVDNAKAILDTIVKIKESRTTVFITHSVEAMRRCDRILCLGGGRVVEDGTFEELVARGGEFAQLMQTGEWE